jgi:hypothetical protein
MSAAEAHSFISQLRRGGLSVFARKVAALCLTMVLSPAIVALPAQQSAPRNATGQCRDASFTYSATKRGACSRRGGVAHWWGTRRSTAAATPLITIAPRQAGVSREAPATSEGRATTGSRVKVWVNTSSSVYHCPGTRWYGATKRGDYMAESEAQATGNRPAYGRRCG